MTLHTNISYILSSEINNLKLIKDWIKVVNKVYKILKDELWPH